MTAFSAKVKDLQQRQDDFEKSGRGGPSAERERRKFEKEAAEIKKEEAELNAERDKLQAGGNEAVNRLNAKVDAQQQAAQAWNDKSKKLTADQQAYEDDRIAWLDNCGNRRYREDDEKAIKAGK
jgi:chromosome segregation ATPase